MRYGWSLSALALLRFVGVRRKPIAPREVARKVAGQAAFVGACHSRNPRSSCWSLSLFAVNPERLTIYAKRLTVICAVGVLIAASFAVADVDLSGEYWFGGVGANVSGSPWAEGGSLIVDGNSWLQEWDDYGGHHTFTSAYTASVDPDGSVDIELSSGTYNVAWNGNVMIHAVAGSGIEMMVRKATTVTATDVIGEYKFFGHWLGWDERWDEVQWGDVQFNGDGVMNMQFVSSDNYSDTFSANWALDDVNRVLVMTGTSVRLGFLGESGINTAYQHSTSSAGYDVLFKKSTQTITPADMGGRYQIRFLESGPGGVPYTCGRGTLNLNVDGTGSVDAYYSDGEHDTKDISFSVGPGNKITFDGAEEGIISPDKGLILVPEYTFKSQPRQDFDWIGGLFFVREPNIIEHSPAFLRGDVNDDGLVNIADPVRLLSYLFADGAAPTCQDAADGNDDGDLNIADPIAILSYLFANGPLSPPGETCGVDPKDDDLPECVTTQCK
jgi:hypothetical protein